MVTSCAYRCFRSGSNGEFDWIFTLNPAMGCGAKAQRRKEEADADKQALTHRVSVKQCASLCVSAPLRDIRSSLRRI